jgi:hypothetical protein
MALSDYPDSIIPHYGGAAVGDSRFPRHDIETTAMDAMTRSNGLRLFGLRRIGKSTLLEYCAEELGKKGFHVIKIDAEGMNSEEDLLYAILGNLPNNGISDKIFKAISNSTAIPKTIRSAIENRTKSEINIVDYLTALSQIIGNQLREADVPLALVIDEFSFLCRNIISSADSEEKGARRIEILLSALRKWRTNGIPMLLSGSIGLAALARQYGVNLTHNNDLDQLDLPPFQSEEREVATRFVSALVQGARIEGWSDQHTAIMLEECIAWYPSLMQHALLKLTPNQQAVPVEKISDLFAEKIRLDLDENLFQQFDRRFKLYDDIDPSLKKTCNAICGAVLKSEQPMSLLELSKVDQVNLEAEELAEVLRILQEDGFLTARVARDGEQNWRVASSLVTAWWQQRRGK